MKGEDIVVHFNIFTGNTALKCKFVEEGTNGVVVIKNNEEDFGYGETLFIPFTSISYIKTIKEAEE